MRILNQMMTTVLITMTICSAALSQTFTTLNDPLSPNSTYLTGISGSTIVGYDGVQGSHHAIEYDGTAFTTIDNPSAPTGSFAAEGISGTNILVDDAFIVGSVGYIQSFLYNGSSYSQLSVPSGGNTTQATGIDGNNVVGAVNLYEGVNGDIKNGFIYNGSSYTTFLYGQHNGIGGTATTANAISGDSIVCLVGQPGSASAFVYSVSAGTYKYLAPPGNFSNFDPLGISGSDIVGTYEDGNGVYHGFLFNGTTYETIDDPLVTIVPGGLTQGIYTIPQGTWVTGIWGNEMVGYYTDANGVHGFTASVPEPSLLSALGMAAMVLLAKPRCIRRRVESARTPIARTTAPAGSGTEVPTNVTDVPAE